jgi:YesN/AraC family two-component response regulator
MIEILIADDHEIVRRGLKQIVMETSDIIVTGEASNGQEVLQLFRERS